MLVYHGTSLSATMQHGLQIVQNKMVRFILNKRPREHIGHTELKSVGFLNAKDWVSQLGLNLTHTIFYDKSPEYLKIHFTKTSQLHSHNTRGSNYNFVIPQVNTVTSKTFYYNAIKDWNALPEEIQSMRNRASFKKSVKKYLFDRAQIRENNDTIYY